MNITAPELPVTLYDMFQIIKTTAAFCGKELAEKVKAVHGQDFEIPDRFEWTNEEVYVLLDFLSQYEEDFDVDEEYTDITANLFLKSLPLKEIPDDLVEWTKLMYLDIDLDEDDDPDFQWIYDGEDVELYQRGSERIKEILEDQLRKRKK